MSSIRELKSAAKEAALALRAAAVRAPPDAAIDRITVDVSLDGKQEIVAIRLRDGALTWSCTCGKRECEHAAVALSGIEEEAVAKELKPAEPYRPKPGSSWSRLSWPPDLRAGADSEPAEPVDIPGLASALEDLVTEAVRAGTEAGMTPPVEEAVRRLADVAPQPLPLGISRWIGRFKVALSDGSVEGAARLLEGARRLAEHFRSGSRDPTASRRIVSWLGAAAGDKRDLERLSDRNLLEVAREWMDGVEPFSIEKRYLIDLQSGEIFLEERARNVEGVSLGPCPRLISVGLAVAEQGAPPRRIRPMQYSTSIAIPAEAWSQMASWASRAFAPLKELYEGAVVEFPGLTEPFAIVAPARLVRDPHPVPLDEAGHPLPLAAARDPYALKVLDALVGDRKPEWIAGRLVDAQGTLMMRPLSVGVAQGDRLRHARL